MKKSRKFVIALTGLAVLCVCAAVAAPLATGDGAGRGGMAKGESCQDGACSGTAVMNEECIQQMIQRMQENGIDTTGLETALENGDQEAVRAFMQQNRPADAPAMNEERMQLTVQRMQENGIDTADLETALENGDLEAVRAFMQQNRPADAPAKEEICQSGDADGNRMQFALRTMAENGIDTSTLETALENGDMETVRAFMQENRPADAGEGCRHGIAATG